MLMDYKIYKTPDPHNRLDTSSPYEKGIADLLLHFDQTIHHREGLTKIITVPARNKAGFNVAACQSYQPASGNATYVLVPKTERLYLFSEAIVPIHDMGKRILKAGFKGLFLGAEEKGIICQAIAEDGDHWKAVCSQNISQDDWYHFTGTAEYIFGELQKKCALTIT